MSLIDFLEMDTHAQGSYSGPINAGWYGYKASVADQIRYVDLGGGFLDGFSGGDMPIPYYSSYDIGKMFSWAEEEFGVEYNPVPFTDDHMINEKTASAYIQFHFESELYDTPLSVVTGLRYEQTDVEGRILQQESESLVWLNPTEWQAIFSDEQSYSHETNDDSVFLPNLDVNLEIQGNLMGRFFYSQTNSRENLATMRASTLLTPLSKVGSRTGFLGNTQLKPYTSNNIVLSLVYYYGDSNYVSVGWFNKEVETFLVNTIESVSYSDLLDPYHGGLASQPL
ncbi:TonB-dependent receptor [Shewanella sp. KX20019]|uniref:TonB-dependent receptor domain-containing protein n=1 Tax=Shewanella sp. KX20019 TaxID=2803864 RepID=UPI001928D8F1|nr:TonB-dependent receptor [Shewanella sp. KX20019]QQX80886.1 TonB-dependent receptor [Shewanella sp. KX20019]